LDLVPEGSTILTYSYSSTVLEALRSLKKEGKNFDVICSESRPMLEGVALAEKLGLEGIPVRLTTDAALLGLLSECQMVFVGADSLSDMGLVNKVGTSGLAMAAKERGVDFFTLCGKEKLSPGGRLDHIYEPKDWRELVPEEMTNVTVINHYFDLTPLKYITGVITEEGIKRPDEILVDMKVYEGLR